MAQRVAELLQKIKVAKIQKSNFESFKEEGGGVMLWGKDDNKFSVGEDIEGGNWILIRAMKHSAISYLEKYIEALQIELDDI